MASQDTNYNSNDYFFLTEPQDRTLYAGKNTVTINVSAKVRELVGPSNVVVTDPSGKQSNTYNMIPQGSTAYGSVYKDAASTVFAVTVYPDTAPGVGRIEIRAKAVPIEATGSAGLLSDARFSKEFYANTGGSDVEVVVWSEAFRFCPNIANPSSVNLFDKPSITANTSVYSLKSRPVCSTRIDTGVGSVMMSAPKHGSSADFNDRVVVVDSQLTRRSGSPFSSSMVGSSVRLSQIEVDSLAYTDVSGEPRVFTGQLNTDFVATVVDVRSDGILRLDRPFTVSNQLLGTNQPNEDTSYVEDTLTNIKKYSPFNETDLYSTVAKSSGIQSQQINQVYTIGTLGVSHRKSYYVCNIKSCTYQIVHQPRISSSQLVPSSFTYQNSQPGEFTRKVCLATIDFTGLRTLSGHFDRYRIYKRSLHYPESPTIIGDGPIEPNEVLVANVAEEDYRRLGEFYSIEHAQRYWLVNGGISYLHTPGTLIDSITIRGGAGANESENGYIILKDLTSNPSRTPAYVPWQRMAGSEWFTSPQLFNNNAVEPTGSYSCAATDPVRSPYLSSIEVNKTGDQHDSNFIHLEKNVMYEFSLDFAGLSTVADAPFGFIAYFKSNEFKLKIGEVNEKTTRGFLAGTYTNKFFTNRAGYGTIILVPKYINEIAIANVSVKPFRDKAYSIDGFSVSVPLTPLVKGEKIEITAELFTSAGELVYGRDAAVVGTNRSLQPLKCIVTADPQWHTLEAFDRSSE